VVVDGLTVGVDVFALIIAMLGVHEKLPFPVASNCKASPLQINVSLNAN
jgi:hypothetical protein